jgi:hypothetical protein
MVRMSELQSSGVMTRQPFESPREAEMIREFATDTGCGAVVVNVEGVVYTGEYEFMTAYGYVPGEWEVGASIPARLAGDKLYLLRPNGRELPTMIVKRIG